MMKVSDLLPGDLLFMRDDSDFSKAVIDATKNYSHVGIFFGGMIYHASRKLGVVSQKLEDFLAEENWEADVFRCPGIDAEAVMARAKKYLGCAYNHSFYPDAEGFYCSQYIAKILPVFGTVPMRFGDGDNEVSEYWRDYYGKLGLSVPLNLPGTNPNQLSSSENLVFAGTLEW